MSNDRFRKAMGHVDDQLLDRYEAYAEKLPRRKLLRWIPLAAVAACLVLVIGAIASIPRQVPVYENALYTAEDIASLFSSDKIDGSTNAYKRIFVSDENQLPHVPLPHDESLTIYRYNGSNYGPDENELSDFLDSILPEFSAAIGINVPQYLIETSPVYDGYSCVSIDTTDYNIYASQTGEYNCFRIYCSYDRLKEGSLTLNGTPVEVDQTQTDETIAANLSDLKGVLFDVFGVSFSNVQIIRSYDTWSQYGVTFMTIRFYNEDAHPLNKYSEQPNSDYIELRFDNFMNWDGDIVSETVLKKVTVCYYQYRADPSEMYTAEAYAKHISLSEAQLLLKNGYVFGGHSCNLCMAQQKKIDFSHYDRVSLAYVWGRDADGEKTICVPFYAFYKYISTANNGVKTYARTYVPAIEVSGIEEYFKIQEDYHNLPIYKFYEESSPTT